MPIFKFLHILSMFFAVGIAVGSDLLLYRIAQTREVSAIRAAFDAAWKYTTTSQLLFVVGMIFGLLNAFFSGFNFFAPWLLIAYVLLGVILILRGSVTTTWQQRVWQAAKNNSPDLETLLDDTTPRTAIWAYIVLSVIIVYVMTLKPGGIQ
ncbi:MAG: DUF2269 family protein [Chloroflexi bacterium]|nr:DUF2269 family protein [Chloroflexota bacterium]